MADDFLNSLPDAPQQNNDDWSFDSLPAAPRSQDEPSFWTKVKDDAENIVSNWWNGLQQSWNEMGRAQKQQTDLIADSVLNDHPIDAQEYTADQNYISDAGQLGLNSLSVVPAVGMRNFIASGIEQGIESGNPLDAARALTYGPLADKLSQPDLGEQFDEHPLETGGELVLDALPLAGAATMGYKGVKAGMKYAEDAADLKPLEDSLPDAVDSSANIDDLEDISNDATGTLEDTLPESQPAGGNFDTFMDAVSGQESGGNYDARNSDTGAYGKFQIMPENWDSWRDEAANAGVDVGSGEMSDPAAQEAVARFKMQQYYDEYGPDGALVAWYAGPANAERWAAGDATDIWDRPWDSEQSNGPSIAEYVNSTMHRAAGNGYKDNGVRGESNNIEIADEQPFDVDTSSERTRETLNNQDTDIFSDKMNDNSDNLVSSEDQIKADTENAIPQPPAITDVKWDNIPNNIMTLYRGEQGDLPNGRHLSRQRNIYDVIGDNDSNNPSLANVKYYTESPDVAKTYANVDQNILQAIKDKVGAGRFDANGKWIPYTDNDYIDIFNTVYGHEPRNMGNVKSYNVNVGKTLDLSDLGENPTYYELEKRILDTAGLKRSETTDNSHPDWELIDDRLRLSDMYGDNDNLPVYMILKNNPRESINRADEFIKFAKEHGYDSIKYAEDGTNHYAVFDKSNQTREIAPNNVDLMRTPAGQDAIRTINDSLKEMSKSTEDTYFDAALNGDYAKAAEMARQAGANDFAEAFQKLADTKGGTVPLSPRLKDTKTTPYSGNTITMRQILNRAQQLFVPIRNGRIGMRDVEGFANHNTGVIRMRNYGDLNVLSHELGHITDAAFGLRGESGAFDNEFSRVVRKRFGNAYDSSQTRAEGIAEFMHDYLTNELRAKQEFPKYYNAFKDKLSQNPDMQGRINELKSMIDTWQKQSPEARARSSVAYQKDIEPSLMQKLKNAYNKFVEGIVDDKDPIKRATESYEKLTGKKLDTQDNPYKMARLAQNSATARAQMLIEGSKPELVKNALNKSYGGIIDKAVTLKSILKNLDKSVRGKYSNYLKQGGFANWHEALDALLLARRQAEIQRIYPNYKGPLNSTDATSIIKNAPAELTRAAKQIYAYNDNILKIMRYTGMIKPEVYDALTKKYQNYVPMARDFSDEAGIIKGFGMAGKGYANIRNIMKSLSEEGSTRAVISPLESITKNTYALLNLAERNKVGQIFARLAEGDRVGAIVERVKGTATQKDSTFSVWVNGEKQVYQTTPEIYKAIMSMNQESAGIVAKLLSPPAQLLRAGATLMPDFAVKNILRDSFGAIVFSRYGFRPIIDHIAGIIHMAKQDQLFQNYKASGALMSTMVGLDRDFVQTSIKGLYTKDMKYYWKHYNPVQILRGFSEVLETATRLGEYSRAIKKGAPIEDAALSARDISLDFSKAGSWGRPYNKITAFFNAGVQEPARIIQAFKENPKETAAKTMLAITLPSVVLWTMNHDKDWYKELPMWQKNIFWMFKAGDTVYRIPKPFGLGVIFGSLPERTLDWLADKRPNAMKQWAKSAFDAFMPNIMPTAIGPIIEWMSNYSFFTGRNIVPDREQKLPDAQQYGANTSELAKSIGKMFGISPRKIDNVIQGYGAGMATQTLNAIDYANGKRDMQNPLAKAFTIDPMKSPQSIQDFYDKLNDTEKTYNGAKATKSRLDHDDLYNYRLMDFANKRMQFLNKRERIATQNKDNEAVSRINAQQLKVAQDALKMYRNK